MNVSVWKVLKRATKILRMTVSTHNALITRRSWHLQLSPTKPSDSLVPFFQLVKANLFIILSVFVNFDLIIWRSCCSDSCAQVVHCVNSGIGHEGVRARLKLCVTQWIVCWQVLIKVVHLRAVRQHSSYAFPGNKFINIRARTRYILCDIPYGSYTPPLWYSLWLVHAHTLMTA